MDRIIILAAGEATRWNNYMNTPKHLVDVGGVPLLHRTVQQFSEHGKVFLTAPVGDERYVIQGAELFHPEHIEDLYDTKKLLDNKDLWSADSRTIILWGDVFFTNRAVGKIMRHRPKDWSMYGRFGPSSLTGCEYGELFAFSFMPHMRPELEIGLHTLAIKRKYDLINRVGGWELYRWLSKAQNLEFHARYRNFVEINDETEDFDFPHDYERWVEKCLPRLLKSTNL